MNSELELVGFLFSLKGLFMINICPFLAQMVDIEGDNISYFCTKINEKLNHPCLTCNNCKMIKK